MGKIQPRSQATISGLLQSQANLQHFLEKWPAQTVGNFQLRTDLEKMSVITIVQSRTSTSLWEWVDLAVEATGIVG